MHLQREACGNPWSKSESAVSGAVWYWPIELHGGACFASGNVSNPRTYFLHLSFLIFGDIYWCLAGILFFSCVWPLFLFNVGAFLSIPFRSFELHCISCHCCICISRELGLGGHCISASTSASASVMLIFLFWPHLPLSLCRNHCHECLELLVFFLFLLVLGLIVRVLITLFLSGC